MSTLPRALLVSLLFCSSIVTSASSQGIPSSVDDLLAPACVSSTAPSVTVREMATSWRLERRYSTDEIDAYANGYDVSLEMGSRTIGLTVAMINGDGTFKSSVSNLGNGEWCASLDTVDVTLGFSEPLVVFVGREYDERSCAYQAILAHELEHVELYAAAISDMVQPARVAVGKSTASFGHSARGTSAESANDALREDLGKVVSQMIERVASYTKAVNARIDTYEEYRAVFASCNDWVASR